MKRQLWFWSGALAAAVASAAMMSGAQAQVNASSASNSVAASAVPASALDIAANRKAMKAADRKLAYAVRKRIEHVKGLDATHITIVAHAGTVTLTGSAPDEKQIGIAIGSAQAVPGVTFVVDRIEVGQLAP